MSISSYRDFIARKFQQSAGDAIQHGELSSKLFPFQRDIVSLALRRGRSAIFADCGMGKTAMQLEWAKHIPGRVLIAAPLAVSHQTVAEAVKFGIDGVAYLRQDDGRTRIVVTNYEMLKNFQPDTFLGVVLDESSILKSYSGKIRTELVNAWSWPRYRLACTATPAPNDYMELGSHAEFLGVMTSSEMLSAFFINDASSVGRYVLKGHAERPFWEWMASWSTLVRKPSDLGYADDGFALPDLNIEHLQVEPDRDPDDGMLFHLPAATMAERLDARRSSVRSRCEKAAEIANGADGPVLIWCNLNDESKLLNELIPGSVEVQGSHSIDIKQERMLGFTSGKHRVLISKPSICGWGMNWQHCATAIFTGLTDSYEAFYQAIRRNWRFGQTKPVTAYVISSTTEGAVTANIRRKESQMQRFSKDLAEAMRATKTTSKRFATTYNHGTIQKPSWNN